MNGPAAIVVIAPSREVAVAALSELGIPFPGGGAPDTSGPANTPPPPAAAPAPAEQPAPLSDTGAGPRLAYVHGLRLSVPGEVVRKLWLARAEKHRLRAAEIRATVPPLLGAANQNVEAIPKMQDTVNQIRNEENGARECEFYATYTDTRATYELGNKDLYRLGVLANPPGYGDD